MSTGWVLIADESVFGGREGYGDGKAAYVLVTVDDLDPDSPLSSFFERLLLTLVLLKSPSGTTSSPMPGMSSTVPSWSIVP
jgi:hypothetical protein